MASVGELFTPGKLEAQPAVANLTNKFAEIKEFEKLSVETPEMIGEMTRAGAEIVEKNGVIISEFPFEYPPLSYNFPQRNRIVTGLSKGVIIAEAKLKSGAMISARFALEQNKELMCIPGSIQNPNCEGIYHLLKENCASIITNTNDVLDILSWDITAQNVEKPSLSGIENEIYEIISKEEISVEGLKQKLDVGINELVEKLTEMELNGLIIQKNGFYYILGI